MDTLAIAQFRISRDSVRLHEPKMNLVTEQSSQPLFQGEIEPSRNHCTQLNLASAVTIKAKGVEWWAKNLIPFDCGIKVSVVDRIITRFRSY